MSNLSEIMLCALYILMLVICLFVIVHATLQIQNSQLVVSKDQQKNKKNKKSKMFFMLFISIALFLGIAFKLINGINYYEASNDEKENYTESISELNNALSLEFKIYGKDTYSSAEDFAIALDYRLPIKSLYNVARSDEELKKFSSYEIFEYNLSDFKEYPTLVGYDGIMMSIIRMKNGCKYVNSKYLGKSDCIILVDLNHFQKPNQIGQDRTLFAIDGIYNTIKTDSNFFKQ